MSGAFWCEAFAGRADEKNSSNEMTLESQTSISTPDDGQTDAP